MKTETAIGGFPTDSVSMVIRFILMMLQVMSMPLGKADLLS